MFCVRTVSLGRPEPLIQARLWVGRSRMIEEASVESTGFWSRVHRPEGGAGGAGLSQAQGGWRVWVQSCCALTLHVVSEHVPSFLPSIYGSGWWEEYWLCQPRLGTPEGKGLVWESRWNICLFKEWVLGVSPSAYVEEVGAWREIKLESWVWEGTAWEAQMKPVFWDQGGAGIL